MLRSIKSLFKYSIEATDGDIGRVEDFYFDDDLWIIRYLVADTGKWISEKMVLISVDAFSGEPDWDSKTFPVSLTREMVKNSPDIESERPVSREMEIEILKYFNWPVYWQMKPDTSIVGPTIDPEEKKSTFRKEEEVASRSHLRSTKELMGYFIKARNNDTSLGHVTDFIVDDTIWNIRYMVVDTGAWLPGKKVLIAPLWIEKVSWSESTVSIDMTQKEIKESPPYDPNYPVNREYEEILFDYYGRPRYWM